MKLVREYINERFTDDSDPIKDMGIGMKHKIKEWLEYMNEKYSYKCILNYKINDNYTIDADRVDMSYREIKTIPKYIKFNNIK